MMKKISNLFVGAVAVASAACTTPYMQVGWKGLGYRDMRVAAHVYQVDFTGSTFDSPQRVRDLALLRAADVCIADKNDFFVVLDKGQDTQSSYSAVAYGGNGAATAYGSESKEVAVHLEVRCVPDQTATGGVNYDARAIATQVRSRYDIKW